MDFANLLEKPIHSELARFAQYCLDLAAGRDLPRREDFAPGAAFSHLGNMYLLEITAQGDYVPSLFGVRMSVLYDNDMTGFPLGDFGSDASRNALRQTYDAAIRAKKPVYIRGSYVWSDKTVGFERLMVPMTDADGKVPALLCSTVLDVSDAELETFKGSMPARLTTDEMLVCE